MIKAYCIKCAKVQEVVDVSEVRMKEGRTAKKGTCVVCGDTVFDLSEDGTGRSPESNN